MMDIDVTSGDVITNTFENLPTDWYTAQITEAELVTKPNGQRLELTWEVIEGPFEKRRVWQREWAQHSTPTAQDIGQRMIRTIGQACGLTRVTDAADLKFKPVQIRVGLGKKEEGYEQRNEVKTARKIGSAPAAASASAPSAKPATPWGAKAA